MNALDLKLALDFARFCQRSYTESTVASPSTGASVLIEGNVFAFKGSSNLKDYLADGRIVQVGWTPNDEKRVHIGFNRDVRSLATSLLDIAETLAPIVVTGNSLAGAIAVLFATLCRENNIAVETCQTFGQPRVGNGAFCAYAENLIGDSYMRFVNDRDIVPRSPLPGVIFPYRHFGNCATLGDNGAIAVSPFNPITLAKGFSATWSALRQNWELICPESLTDHHIQAYIAALLSSAPISEICGQKN
jgi:hypothetical protein